MNKIFKRLCLAGMVLLAMNVTVGCSSDDDPTPEPVPEPGLQELVIGTDEVRASLYRRATIEIKSGNGEYTLAVVDEEVAEAILYRNEGTTTWRIAILPKSVGETVLTVTDRVTETSREVAIEVYSPYFAMWVKSSNHPLIPANGREVSSLSDVSSTTDNFLQLHGRDQLTFEVFQGGSIPLEGSYSIEGNILTLTYEYPEGNTLTEAYDISDSSTYALNDLESLGWTHITTKSPGRPATALLRMRGVYNGYELECVTSWSGAFLSISKKY